MRSLSANQVAYACRVAPSWWIRAWLIDALGPTQLGGNTLNQIVEAGVNDRGRDAALAAGWKGMETAYVPPGRRKSWNKSAELLMRELGMIHRSTANYCGINHAFHKLDSRIPVVNWQKLLGSRYPQAELQAVEIVAASGVNITGLVSLLDVFNDLLLDAVITNDGTVGGYNLGHIGSVLNAPTGKLAIKFPKTYALAKEVHDRRYESMASHPLIKKTGKATKRISYKFLPTARRLLRECVSELKAAGFV